MSDNEENNLESQPQWRQHLEFEDSIDGNREVEMHGISTADVSNQDDLEHTFLPVSSGIQQRRSFHHDLDNDESIDKDLGNSSDSIPKAGQKQNNLKPNTKEDEEEIEVINEIQQAIISGVDFAKSQIENYSNYMKEQYPQSVIITVGIIVIVVSIIVIIKGAVKNTIPEFQMAMTKQRPAVLRNGVINPMASDQYDIIEPMEGFVTTETTGDASSYSCLDKYFRCEYYWAGETSNAGRLDKTFFCTYYVCKGMTVKVSVFPQTCSGSNRVGIVKYDHEIYYSSPLSYACSNTGCGECSSAQVTVTEGTTLAFLQGCNDELSCYGQIEVSIVPSAFAKTLSKESKLQNKEYQIRQYPKDSPIPRYRGVSSQGYSIYRANDLSTIEWKFRTNYGFKSTPVIDDNGSIYIGSDDHSVYSLESNGAIRWRFVTQGKVTATAALSNRESLYIGSEDGTFYCLAIADGTLKWEYKTNGKIFSSAVIGFKGIVYFGSYDGHLYAMSAPGDVQWAFSTLSRSTSEPLDSKGKKKENKGNYGAISSSPALSPIDGTIYFGSEDSNFFAVSPAGELKFAFKTGDAIYSSPAISSDGNTIYFGSDDGYLYALSNTGVLKFRYRTGDRIRSSPAIGLDGTVVFVQDDKSGEGNAVVFALTPSGLLKWKYELSEGSVSSPTISADGTIFVGADDHCIYAINIHDGMLKSIFKTEGKITSSPVIAADGTVYVGSWISAMSTVPCSLYAFGKATGKSVDSNSLTTAQEIPASVSSWWCSDLAGGDIEYRCGGTKSDVTCLPGLDSFIGRGVDITYGRNEKNFVRGRIYDFTDIVHPVTINSVDFVAPSTDVLTVIKGSVVKPIDPMSGFYNSVQQLTLARSAELKLGMVHSFYPAGKVPHSATLTIVANATSINSDMASQVHEMAKTQKYSFSHIATVSPVGYRMKTSSAIRHMCAKSFHDRIRDLPLVYDEAIYKKFVSDFGTHVVIGARVGGTISTFASVDSCSAVADYPSPKDAFNAFKNNAAKFTLNSSDPIFNAFDRTIKRAFQWTCGGRSSYYSKFEAGGGVGGDRPFTAWSASIFKDKNKPCLISPELIPIWATIRPVDSIIQGHVAAAVLDYLRDAIAMSEIDVAQKTVSVGPCASSRMLRKHKRQR